MQLPFVLFVLSAVALVVALVAPGLSDGVLVAGPAALASLLVLLRISILHGGWWPFRKARPIVIDGSNVLYWKDRTPQISALREVVEYLFKHGYRPSVVFDANAGYLVSGTYQHDGAMGALLGLPEERVIVVAKGSPADPTVLQAARDMGACIVTNDRYRDWAKAYPEVRKPGHLIRGGFRDTGVWLDLKR